jgi:hypothetical protein
MQMTFEEWDAAHRKDTWNGGQTSLREQYRIVWSAAIGEARRIALSVNRDAVEASKAKDATNYVAGYQDAAIDVDEALRELLC